MTRKDSTDIPVRFLMTGTEEFFPPSTPIYIDPNAARARADLSHVVQLDTLCPAGTLGDPLPYVDGWDVNAATWYMTDPGGNETYALAIQRVPRLTIYRVLRKSTSSLQPGRGETWWERENLYCGSNREQALVTYWKHEPAEISRGFGNSCVRIVVERIDDVGADITDAVITEEDPSE